MVIVQKVTIDNLKGKVKPKKMRCICLMQASIMSTLNSVISNWLRCWRLNNLEAYVLNDIFTQAFIYKEM